MAGGEKFTVHMCGGGPWGFRLYGGEDDPLVIAKLRKKSKAAEAGIIEGDVLLGINGYSCKGLDHPTAMALIEQSGQNLTFQMFRGSANKRAVDAAYQDLGSNLQSLSASQVPSSSYQQAAQQPLDMSHSQEMVNGFSQQQEEEGPGVTRLRQMFQQGDTTRQVTTETSKQQIGGTTITKVKREEVTHSGTGPSLSPYPVQEPRGPSPLSNSTGPSLSPYPAQEQRGPSPRSTSPMFQVSNNMGSVSKKPGVWAPSGQAHKPMNAPLKVTAPRTVNVEHNPDQSVTMTFGLDSKENIAPPQSQLQQQSQQPKAVPTFNVKKNVTGSAAPGSWQAASMPAQQQQAPAPLQQQPENREDFTHFPFETPTWPGRGASRMDTSEPIIDDSVVNVHLAKILHEGPGSDYESGNESPGTFWTKKKKIFADSSFYDDPEHKYPTIEEQIKMARKVALSLLAPANRNARGHKMFVKRKEKAIRWTTGMMPGDPLQTELNISEDEDEKYFNPNPWQGEHTWQPPSQQPVPQQLAPAFKPTPPPQVPPVIPPPPPPPPPPMDNLWKPSRPYDRTDGGENKQLNANEVEKMLLHGQKSKHTSVPPQLAFSLAEDLRKMKGKGGRLFAKRREKSEKWVVGETFGQADADPNIMKKIVLSAHHGEDSHAPVSDKSAHGYVPPTSFKGGMPVNRLQNMVEPPKPKMTPWDACADFGDVDKAFDHLDGYLSVKKGDYKSAVAQCLDKAAQRSYMTPFRPDAKGVPVNVQASAPSKMPDYSSKIKPWQSSGGVRSEASPAPVNITKSSLNTEAAGGRFRPVKFNAPSSERAGVFDATGPVWRGGVTPVGGAMADVSGELGYCDL